jgi:hypothetical protein
MVGFNIPANIAWHIYRDETILTHTHNKEKQNINILAQYVYCKRKAKALRQLINAYS